MAKYSGGSLALALLGTVMCLAGVCLGLYVGVWWAFVGGIVQIIDQVKASDTNSMAVAVGIVKIVGAGLFGWLAAILLILPGSAIVKRA